MAHWVSRLSQPSPTNRKDRRPEWYMILAWVGSYLGLLLWLKDEMSKVDFCVFTGVYLACLPLISRRTTPAIMAWLGGPVCGLIAGMQCIDLVFDLCILRGISISDGTSVFNGKQLAYLYYRAVLNSSHVNAALLVIILVSFLGSFIGLGRSSPEVRKQWITLGVAMVIGTGGYLIWVVTKYMNIRSATAFHESLFDGWGMVLVARLQLYASLVVSLPFMHAMSTMPPAVEKWDAIANKLHEQ